MRYFSGEDPNALPSADGQSRILVLSLLGMTLLLAWQAFALRPYVGTRDRAWSKAEVSSLEHFRAARDGIAQWPPRPPLYPWLASKIQDSAAPGPQVLWINWFCLVVLCLAVFGITYHFRPDESALIAVIFLLGAPLVQRSLTALLIAMPLAALTACAYWALLRSSGFSRWPGSLAFGALFSLGMLLDWSFSWFMLPSYLLAIGALFVAASRMKVLAAAAIALAGFGPWYAVHSLDLALFAFLR